MKRFFLTGKSRGRRFYRWGAALAFTLILSGCGGKPAPTGKKDPAKAKDGVRYEENVGLIVPEETRRAVGIATAEVVEQEFRHPLLVKVQVYRAGTEKASAKTRAGFAYASGLLPADSPREITAGQTVTLRPPPGAETLPAVIVEVDRQTQNRAGRAEILVEIPDAAGRFPLGDAFEAVIETGVPTRSAAIPKSALLAAAEGRFVYVENGPAYLRRPVTTGGESGDALEITEGLQPGERVVVRPVESLWLMELKEVRGTAGGG